MTLDERLAELEAETYAKASCNVDAPFVSYWEGKVRGIREARAILAEHVREQEESK